MNPTSSDEKLPLISTIIGAVVVIGISFAAGALLDEPLKNLLLNVFKISVNF